MSTTEAKPAPKRCPWCGQWTDERPEPHGTSMSCPRVMGRPCMPREQWVQSVALAYIGNIERCFRGPMTAPQIGAAAHGFAHDVAKSYEAAHGQA